MSETRTIGLSQTLPDVSEPRQSAVPSPGFVIDPEIHVVLTALGEKRRIGKYQGLTVSTVGDIKAVFTHGIICFDAHGHLVKKEGV